ncbi:cytochrome d ubiquinol oxidase subunit II [Actinoplanes auranticolor]|uniref:Cytochrome c oxidase assembly protein n=1 Tax=Actinoplanes auranticolor TaxID=47988 RepID=A0A919SUD8_9ACTN|nr:cytochrome d ubiquinol oxidase subunit II [Actinoplanes auranticolor]GIM77691.1 cytochrome c oxidase assembly protein [Actinoplanes auranticolor]
MELTTFWFGLIAVLWAGYFLLEGFDFGVGILLPVLGRDDRERRLLINTIGPVWDGNEVWLLVAGGATFAAFPEWYATLFSGFYLPLLLILVALILRGVAFEYRGKRDDAAWKRRWDYCIIGGSLVPALLWGVAFGNIIRGVRLDADHEYVGGFFELLNPYALLGGLTTLTLFTLHGAVFLALKTGGEMRERAGRLAAAIAGPAIAVAGGFLLWTATDHHDPAGWLLSAAAAVALIGAAVATQVRREGWAFLATGATLVLAVFALFVTLFPDVMPSSIAAANSLTVDNASSTPYTLKVMTWVAVVFTPIVLAYQGWTYWVFRQRLTVEHIPVSPPPATRETV